MAELEEENRRVVEQKADLLRWCERQELDRYRALEAQREKWEERKARLVRQLESLRNLSGEVCEVRPIVSAEREPLAYLGAWPWSIRLYPLGL